MGNIAVLVKERRFTFSAAAFFSSAFFTTLWYPAMILLSLVFKSDGVGHLRLGLPLGSPPVAKLEKNGNKGIFITKEVK